MTDFTKNGTLRVRSRFSPKEKIDEVLAFILEQKVPGTLCVSIPGNGGVTSIEFTEKDRPYPLDEESS
jgi:hypothetical protein